MKLRDIHAGAVRFFTPFMISGRDVLGGAAFLLERYTPEKSGLRGIATLFNKVGTHLAHFGPVRQARHAIHTEDPLNVGAALDRILMHIPHEEKRSFCRWYQQDLAQAAITAGQPKALEKIVQWTENPNMIIHRGKKQRKISLLRLAIETKNPEMVGAVIGHAHITISEADLDYARAKAPRDKTNCAPRGIPVKNPIYDALKARQAALRAASFTLQK